MEQIAKDMGSFFFTAQYLGNPTPIDGNAIKRAWLKTYASLPKRVPGSQVIIACDNAVSAGRDNDYTVMIVALIIRNSIYIVDVLRAKMDFPEQKKALIRLALEHKANTILIEKASAGDPLAQVLRDLGAPGVPTPIAIPPRSSKEERLTACSARIEAGDVLLPEEAVWKEPLVHELCGFPYGRYDDQVDALTLLIGWHSRRLRNRGPIPVPGYILNPHTGKWDGGPDLPDDPDESNPEDNPHLDGWRLVDPDEY